MNQEVGHLCAFECIDEGLGIGEVDFDDLGASLPLSGVAGESAGLVALSDECFCG
jgi:hypothetical protein